MCWKVLILCQYTINRSTECSIQTFHSGVSEEMIQREVAHNAVTPLPVLHVVPDGNNFSGHVRAGDNLWFDPRRILACNDCYITILLRCQRVHEILSVGAYVQRDSMDLDKNFAGLRRFQR